MATRREREREKEAMMQTVCVCVCVCVCKAKMFTGRAGTMEQARVPAAACWRPSFAYSCPVIVRG